MDYDLTIIADQLGLNDDQRDALEWADRRATDLYPDDDMASEREQVLSGAMQYIAGDTTPEQIKSAIEAARHALSQTMDQARGLIIAADFAGVPETQIADLTGLNRMTVRAALGK